ncbi:hypothetical protein ABT052_02555 [Streptomyces sp. NPDC002766]|uniref:hypothetical protein n=1 Tax=Streptomyces sp. NPDC002766 TaxID=3154429 RepID=UPI0033226F4D
MTEAGDEFATKVDVDQLIELTKGLEHVKRSTLKRALKEINFTARTQRIDMYFGHATTALGTLVAGGAVAAFAWLAHSMVEAHEAGYGVLVCGLPASSLAAIFVIKKMPDFKALASMARQVQSGQQQGDQVPSARTPSDGNPSTSDQNSNGL